MSTSMADPYYDRLAELITARFRHVLYVLGVEFVILCGLALLTTDWPLWGVGVAGLSGIVLNYVFAVASIGVLTESVADSHRWPLVVAAIVWLAATYGFTVITGWHWFIAAPAVPVLAIILAIIGFVTLAWIAVDD